MPSSLITHPLNVKRIPKVSFSQAGLGHHTNCGDHSVADESPLACLRSGDTCIGLRGTPLWALELLPLAVTVQPSFPGAGHLPGSLQASVSSSLEPPDSNLGQPPGSALLRGAEWCPLQGLSCHVPASGPSQTTPMAVPNFILWFPVQTGPPCPLESRVAVLAEPHGVCGTSHSKPLSPPGIACCS